MRSWLLLTACLAAPVHARPTVEVIHFWTSGAEAQSLQVLKTAFEKAGGRWIDLPIGAGDNIQQVLTARSLSGQLPTAAILHQDREIALWGDEGALADIDEIGRRENWDAALPKAVAAAIKYRGKFVAAPLGISRFNALFANPRLLRKAGVRLEPGWPHDFEEFNAAEDKLKAAGLVPLAHGNEPWQDEFLFRIVALGVGGPAFYKKAFFDLDPQVLSGPMMVKIFDEMRRLRSYSDKSTHGGWSLPAGMVLRGEAGALILGDFVRNLFSAAGKKPDDDYLCLPGPGSAGSFLYMTDYVVMFKTADKDRAEGQKLLASVVMSPEVQENFSLVKGAIPARRGVSKARFDVCSRRAMDDLASANAHGTAFQAFGVLSPGVIGAIKDAAIRHFNSDMDSQEAARRLANDVQAAKE